MLAVGGTVYLSQHQAEIKAALESIPAIPLPPFQLPGTTLEENINPCYEAGPNVGQPDVWQLPPFSLGTPPYFGPVRPGISLERPSVLGNNVFLADSRSSVEIRRSIRSLEKQIAEHQRKIDQRIGFDPISSDPVINQRAAEARLRHLQHEIEEFRRQIEQLVQELRSRGETP